MTKKKTIQEFTKEYDEALRDELQRGLKKLPELVTDMVNKGAEEIILNSIGMTHRWHGEHWEVDHCNGRRTELANEIGKLARAQVETLIQSMSDKFVPSKSMKDALMKEYVDHYLHEARNEIRNAAHARAMRDVGEFLKKRDEEESDK